MNDITYAVSVDVNNPIIPYNVYVASVLDSNVRHLEITLYQNGNVIALSNTATATASLVTDNVLVNDSVDCTISNNIITVPLEGLQRHGNLDVQVTVTEGTKVLAIPFPIQVRVTPNIAEEAQIDNDSLGSYAEVVREIAAARGDYPDLKDRLDGEIDRIDDDISDINTALLGKANKAAAGSAGELAALDGNGSPIRSGVSVIQSIGEGSNSRVPTTEAVRNALNDAEDTIAENIDSIFQGNSAFFPQLYFEQYFTANGSNYRLIYDDRDGERHVLFDFARLPAAKGEKGDDYILTEQDKTEIAALVNPYVFADEIPPDADHTKKYVLPDGYIYEWREGTPDVPYNANTKIINKRPSTGAHYETALLDHAGVLVSDLIPFDASWKYSSDGSYGHLADIQISGINKLVPAYNSSVIVYYYRRDNGNSLGAALSAQMHTLNYTPNTNDITLPVQFSLMDQNVYFSGVDIANPGATIGYVRVLLGISTAGSITEDDVKDVVINVPFYDTPGTEAGWVSTGEKHPDYIADSIFDVSTNQTLYVVGDSIAYGYGGSGGAKVDSWVKHAIEHNGYNANSMNLSESGLGFCTTSTKSHTINDVVGGTNFSGADVVVVALGINDWKSSATLAQLWTGMQYCFNKIRTDNPYCKIYYLLPFNVSFSGAYATFYGLGFKGDSDATKCYGNTLREFISLIKAKFSEPDFKAYDVRLIDMVECAAINRNNITTALFDNLHPSAATQEALGREIARYIAQDCVSRDRGDKGDPGNDYVLTPQDKTDIADIVLQELPTTQGVLYGNTSN